MESNRMSRHVYLDHNASTPIHPEVVAEMLPYFSEIFGNPSSIHAFGREARDGVDRARERPPHHVEGRAPRRAPDVPGARGAGIRRRLRRSRRAWDGESR